MNQTTTTDLPTLWRTHLDPFTTVVSRVSQWDAPSPCSGWTAADVLTHVIDTQRDFLTGTGQQLPGLSSVDPAERWSEHSAAVTALVDDPATGNAPHQSVFGPTTIGQTLATFYGFDLLVHRWDLAQSQGIDEQFTPDELTEIDTAVDGFGDHAYAPGIFEAAVPVGPEASAQQRVLGRTGRRS